MSDHEPTGYVWEGFRDDLIRQWSDAPGAVLEQRLLDVWERHPRVVIEAAEGIGARFDRGVIRSPWPVLAAQADEAARATERAQAVIYDDDEPAKRARAVKRAEQWLRGAGLHFDREPEVADELFGDFGVLKRWRDDGELRDRMLTLWASVRPAGERVEAEAEERGRRFIASRKPLKPETGAVPF